MSLGRLALAAALVAVVFLGAAFARARRLGVAGLVACAVEAVVLTLLAALWFGSLGHGGWLTLFLLLGVLVGGVERGLRFAFLRSGERRDVLLALLDVARYVAAGAVLAWRLG